MLLIVLLFPPKNYFPYFCARVPHSHGLLGPQAFSLFSSGLPRPPSAAKVRFCFCQRIRKFLDNAARSSQCFYTLVFFFVFFLATLGFSPPGTCVDYVPLESIFDILVLQCRSTFTTPPLPCTRPKFLAGPVLPDHIASYSVLIAQPHSFFPTFSFSTTFFYNLLTFSLGSRQAGILHPHLLVCSNGPFHIPPLN